MPGYHSGTVIGGRKSIAGSGIGGIKETQEMLAFSAKHNIVPEIEIITTDEVKTSPYADYGNSTRTWTPTENAAMQRDIDAIYTLFKSRVATARKLSDTQVSDIAKGRIYSGQDAKAISLIDEIGESAMLGEIWQGGATTTARLLPTAAGDPD